MENDILLNIFGDADYLEKMDSVILPFIKCNARDGFFESYDGKKMHYYQCINPKEKASIVISHGFCEFFNKYHEVVYELFHMGYSVFFIEHRGHGKSYRDVEDKIDMVHITDYEQYIEDMKSFMDLIVKKYSISKKYMMFAHSMGGCIGGLFLEKYPDYFRAAIFSSPMMEMNVGNVPKFILMAMMKMSKVFGWDKKFAPSQHGYSESYKFEDSSALSEKRFEYVCMMRKQHVEFRTFGGSYGWTRASIRATEKVKKDADKIKIPILVFQAGRDRVVKPGGQDEFVAKAKNAHKIVFAQSKHEIYNATEEIRRKYYEDIKQFYIKEV